MKNTNTTEKKLLLIGIGNSGRSDDGLGWAFLDRLQETGLPDADFEYRYQLQVEDAALIAGYEQVIFVDATQESLEEGFAMRPCQAAGHYFFSSHTQAPETILYLAGELYQRQPEAQTLAIVGRDWELRNELSETARFNLNRALEWFCRQQWPAACTAV